jgi:NADH-quinone oxidoreductase subunit C
MADATPPSGPPPASPPAPAAPKTNPLAAPVPSRAVDLLREVHGDAVLESSSYAGQAIVRIAPGRLLEVLTFLRDHVDLRFDYLSNLSGVHWPKRDRPFEIVYHLASMPKRHRLTVKLDLAEGEEAPSAVPVWPAANWFEREAYDLFGIRFRGHPDLTRILLTDEWTGHPLRKDYPLEGKPEDHVQYREVGTAEHVYSYERARVRGFGWRKEVEKTGQGHG